MSEKQHFETKYFDDIDTISENDNYFLPVLKDVASAIDIKTAKVLDVGCGTGLFMSPLIKWGCTEMYGVDGPTDCADRAIKRGYKEVKFVNDLCVDRLPYDDNSFDLIVCKDVFEHLLDPVHSLKEINRVLKTGGHLLLHVPNHFPFYGRLKFLFTNNLDTFSFFPGSSRWEFPHIRFYEHADSIKLLGKEGFSLDRDLSIHFPVIPVLVRFSFFKSFCRSLVAKYPNQFAGGFTFLLRKNNNGPAAAQQN
ncbi:MAG: methyltransferase domain-containing protein [Sediminibacterium sp.]